MPRTPTETMRETDNHPLDKEPVVMTTPLGTDFVIENENNGLYVIRMIKPGGKLPEICKEKFTNLKLAQRALEGYIATKD